MCWPLFALFCKLVTFKGLRERAVIGTASTKEWVMSF